ncbi:acyl-CoA dehydrogenase [Marinobacterium sp. YM272]|uniref:acyl-CoA dehydrogenase n=1 Tax=Marinobacterium sp. YM272 TaxID=3421654 RepID=UPI003D7FE81D
MHNYRYPREEVLFLLNDVIGLPRPAEGSEGEELDSDTVAAVIEEAARFGENLIAPSNVTGDRQPPQLGETGVTETAGFADIYHQFCEAGWPALGENPAYGGQGLPNLISTATSEIWQSGNLAWALCPLLTFGAIDALEHHGSDTLKSIWLEKLISGEWTGTMNLTEPDAGSDLAALKTRAEPEGDHYLIQGQKIFITWGDHQMASNICHLVLARLPDAPAGVKGISLFLVPKYLLDDQGVPAQRNDLRPLAIEHKMGIHGSPTCVMSYGDNGGAVGYLVGEPHQGLTCMFTMMNSARQSVGVQGLAVAERAYQAARDYARERVQGTLKDGSRVTIINHPDVRRMLVQMRASCEAMRAFAYEAAAEVDRARAVEGEEQARREARVALYTPLVKGWLTELAQEVCSLAMQVHGGMGYIEETGVAQLYRDARILPIYEGTTGIQALDLIGRKIAADRGAALEDLFEEISGSLKACPDAPAPLREGLEKALNQARRCVGHLMQAAGQDPAAPAAGSVNLMLLLGYLCGGWMLLRSAQRAAEREKQSDNSAFWQTRQKVAAAYAEQLLVRCGYLAQAASAGSANLMEIDEDQF